MSEQVRESPEFKARDPVTIVKFPDDPLRVAAIMSKRDEYLDSIKKSAGEYMHPEAAALLQLEQGITFCFDMLARAEFIDALAKAGENGVDVWSFADSFLSEHPSFVPGPDTNLADGLKLRVVLDTYVIRAYCEGEESELTGGTGLKLDQPGDKEA